MITNGNITETRKVSLDGYELEDVTRILAKAAEGLTNVHLTVESGWEYGETIVEQYITGWRPATPDEIATQEVLMDRATASVRKRQEQELARLKQQRPDLF